MTDKALTVLAVIPAMNEGKHVGDVVRRVREQNLDVIVVDDGSNDDTAAQAESAGAEVIRHEVNQGKGAALVNGVSRATQRGADAVLLLDADGQHDPAEISLFLEAIREADLVVGTRMTERKNMPLKRWWTNRYMSRVLSKKCGVRLTDTQCGYRMMRISAWQAIEITTTKFDMESEMLIRACRAGLRVVEVPIATIYGEERSHINPIRDAYRWFKMLRRLGKK